jgi:putative monooxygenase
VIDVFAVQARPAWPGRDEEGFRREVFKVARGKGEVAAEDGRRTSFAPHTIVFIPKGAEHRHVNTEREALWPVVVCGPRGEFPRT